jgi:glutathione S-transferase
VHAVQRYRRAE